MSPYPAEWERRARLRDGTDVLIRPIRGEDDVLYPDFMAAESVEDTRRRFLGAVRQLSQAFIFRLTHVDYEGAMAFIAVDEADGKMLGVVRLHRDEKDPTSGEYAVIVRSDYKGRGLGRLLMRQIIDWSNAVGVKSVTALVLADNDRMLKLCRELGFEIGEYPPDRDIRRVSLQLAPVQSPTAS